MSGIRPGLQRISQLLATTDLPWRAIHVGGTNGKGSVCAYISAMLDHYNNSEYRSRHSQKELRHGRFTSPHLMHPHDGITLDQKTIPRERFAAHEQWIRERDSRLKIGASNFEILTAVAFRYFAQPDPVSVQARPADVAVIEVGMGGRDDCTNVLGQHCQEDENRTRALPLVTAFTKIGLDHQSFLGSTLRDIATNKAGIMKPGVAVVYDRSNENDALDILSVMAADRTIPARLDSYLDALLSKPQDETRADDMATNTPHVKQNLSVAFKSTWLALTGLDRIPHITSGSFAEKRTELNALASGMLTSAKCTSFPGRLQYLSIERLTNRSAPVLLDGAHNPQSALVLADEVRRLRQNHGTGRSPVTWVLAATDSKDVLGILKPLLRSGDCVFPVEFGSVEGMPWVRPINTSALAEVIQNIDPAVEVCVSNCGLLDTIRLGSQKAKEGPFVIAGSLYLVGDTLRLLESS